MKKYNKEDRLGIIKAFLKGEIIIMLTDTVYGIMAIANRENEKKINEIKRSNINKKLSVIFPNKELLFKYMSNIDEDRFKLIDDKLPGKYTFIVNLDKFSNFDRIDFGVRITGNNYLQDILENVGPVLATSCNISGEPICNTVEEIEGVFGNMDVCLVVDVPAVNSASTIIDVRDEIKIIRK